MFEQNYRSAMGKFSAGEDWRAQTLRRMQQAQPSAPRRALRLDRRTALLCAAAALLLVVPLSVAGGLYATGKSAPSTAAMDVPAQTESADGSSAAMAAAGPNAKMAAAAPRTFVQEQASAGTAESAAGVLEERTDDGFYLAASGARAYYAITPVTQFACDPALLDGQRVRVEYVQENGQLQALRVEAQADGADAP